VTLQNILFGLVACSSLLACAPKNADAPVGVEEPSQDAIVPDTVQVEVPAEIDSDADLCKSRDYQSLVGTNAAAVAFPAGLLHRIYKEGDPVTADYNAARLNILTDADGVIIEVKCG
jgi:hypothetical protein